MENVGFPITSFQFTDPEPPPPPVKSVPFTHLEPLNFRTWPAVTSPVIATSDNSVKLVANDPTALSTYCLVAACNEVVGSALRIKSPVNVPPDKFNF